jgi:hypothetical protein
MKTSRGIKGYKVAEMGEVVQVPNLVKNPLLCILCSNTGFAYCAEVIHRYFKIN